jgi:guanylate kinase
VARREVDEFTHYDYLVINDDVETAVGRLTAIVYAERSRVKVLRRDAERIIQSFKAGTWSEHPKRTGLSSS